MLVTAQCKGRIQTSTCANSRERERQRQRGGRGKEKKKNLSHDSLYLEWVPSKWESKQINFFWYHAFVSRIITITKYSNYLEHNLLMNCMLSQGFTFNTHPGDRGSIFLQNVSDTAHFRILQNPKIRSIS